MVTDAVLATGSGMGGGVIPGIFAPPESMRPLVMGTHHAAVAGHPLTTDIAMRVLAAGGNAIDAGVAAGIASNVVQPDMANFGGIAPTVVRTAGDPTVWSIDGVGTWSRDVTLQGFLDRHGTRMPLGAPVGIVPGAPAAWIETLARFGTWTLAQVASPAITMAHEGVPVDHRLAGTLDKMTAPLSWPSTLEIYRPSGRALRPSDRLVQHDLGRTLEELVAAEAGHADRLEGLEQARRCFYEGDIAARIAAFVIDGGGWMDARDLSSYRSEVAPAPGRRVGSWDMHTTSTFTQGLVVLQALGIIEGLDIGQDPLAGVWIHRVNEALKLAFSDREIFYGDPRRVSVDVDLLLSNDHLASLRARIGEAALPDLPTHPFRAGTTYISVVDAQGNAFSCAPSDTIDGAPVIPGLGIFCSPRGIQSRLVESHPNRLAPEKRPCVTPAPALAVRTANAPSSPDVWAFGCPGGDVIVQAMVQGVLNVEQGGLNLQQAVEQARFAGFSFPGGFHPHPQGSNLLFLEDRIPSHVAEELRARGHDVRVWPALEFDAGSVQMTRLEHRAAGPVATAAADLRRSAYAQAR